MPAVTSPRSREPLALHLEGFSMKMAIHHIWMFKTFLSNSVYNAGAAPNLQHHVDGVIFIQTYQSERNYFYSFRLEGGLLKNNGKDDLQRAYRQLCRLCSIYRSTDIQIISTTASLCLDDNAQRWRYKGFLPPSCSNPRHLFSLLFTPGSFHF